MSEVDKQKLTTIIEEQIDKQIAKELSTLGAKVENFINARFLEAIAKALGFNNRWDGRWEVDHCNGRNSFFTDHISREAKEHATRMANMFLVSDMGLFLEDEEIEAMKQACKKDFREYVKRDLDREMRTRVDHVVKRVLDSIIDESLIEHGLLPKKKT